MGNRTFAAVVTVLDQFLCVVPGTAGVGEENRHQRAGSDSTPQVTRQGRRAETESDGNRGADGQESRCCQLAQRVLGADIDDFAVLRLAGAIHDPGDLAELTAYLEDNSAGRTTNCADQQA